MLLAVNSALCHSVGDCCVSKSEGENFLNKEREMFACASLHHGRMHSFKHTANESMSMNNLNKENVTISAV